ncbi:aldo/keto reductase [Microlunatus sp. Gsoil 973]|uniref:aldo/keto reductase n=1 Tax=Microlunatus sp. Gsoil 973 TaxID=2672569 RepID=UPI001E2F2498|nr:aldo/keto reductase [Microlunatus sp. Gsoil 973]
MPSGRDARPIVATPQASGASRLCFVVGQRRLEPEGLIMVGFRQLGNTDVEITPIGLGCMQFSVSGLAGLIYPGMQPDRSTEIVKAALDGGINWFDTAEMYGHGHSERLLSGALHALGVEPGSIRIATKWTPFGRRASSIIKTIHDRLDALQGYPIDLHQIHTPRGGLSPIEAQVDAMADLAEAEQIGHVGVSNFSAGQMELAHIRLRKRGLVLASNQVQISLLHRSIETDGVLSTARRLGITLIGYSPLRQGILTGRFHDDPSTIRALPITRRWMTGLPDQRVLRRTEPLINELRRIAAAHDATPAQVALGWVISNYGDTVVCIPGASNASQATESAAVLGLELSHAELIALNDATPGH